METSRICPKCGRSIPAGQAECRCSLRPRRYWLHSRETVLLLSFAVLGLAFLVTGFASRFYHGRRRALAQQWFGRGAADFGAGRAPAALEDFRTALVYARDSVSEEGQEPYELQFVEALTATDRSDEARAYLLDLWDRAPGNAKVNLELARLAVRSGNDSDAKRYYNGAIYGIWDGDADQVMRSRRQTRLELYHYLMSGNQTAAAQPELLAIAASLPPDAALHAQVGGLLLDAGEPQQALLQFQQALRLDRQNDTALAGAGLASFQMGDDRAAFRYLDIALREKSQPQPQQPPEQGLVPVNDPRVAQDLAVAQAGLELDPYPVGLDARERARRAAKSYETAVARIEDCANTKGVSLSRATVAAPTAPPTAAGTDMSDLAALYAKAMKMKDSARATDLLRNPQRIEPLMEFVFEIEAAATDQCGAPADAADLALARIAQRAGGGRP